MTLWLSWIERLTTNQKVAGSNPARATMKISTTISVVVLFYLSFFSHFFAKKGSIINVGVEEIEISTFIFLKKRNIYA